ncbi:hypothetical protein pipiens_015924 [Culex pipiens pipiens]|uniref:TFIIS N-terminal domain-containing protein n=1 Tax=Culex pipiens pipiens TaxID=38569 RepID=A0ABD1CNF0_CULPP
MTSIVENIKHYQKSIDRALNDESRLLHCIAKLYRLPVSVQHLQETGIGRTVNGLRKYDGEVGVAAKALVSKWKSMVAAEESEDGAGGEQQSGGNNHYDQQHDEDDEDDEDNYDESRLQVDEQPQEVEANEDSDQDMHEVHESPRQEARREDSSKDKSKKSSSSEKKRESSSKEKSPRSDNEEEAEEEEGLDSSAGASFADALAMIGMPSSSSSSKKKSSSDKPKKSSSSSMPPPAAKARSEKSSSRSSSSSSKSSRHKGSSSPQSTASSSGYSSSSSSSTVTATAPASLLDRNVALDPLPEASEIVEALPIISPHYKPMPLNQTVMGCVFGSTAGKPPRSHLTEEEALGHSMQSKNQRTKVYSGVKTYNGKVPSLFDSCIRMLQENIDLLDVTGGVPFDLLKPVLDRASPEQLMNLEHYNPYLMEDSDVLWEQHCRRQFRTQKRKEEECESWREMYMRCSEERDAKLRSLTQNIKMSQAEKVAPVRKTQLAYVDSAVKPPRSIISKQARYGTDRTPVVSPAARVAALKSASSNVAKAGDNRLRVAPGVRDTAQAVFQPMKPKKAPMMTKVMNSIKGIKGFRR